MTAKSKAIKKKLKVRNRNTGEDKEVPMTRYNHSGPIPHIPKNLRREPGGESPYKDK